MPAFIGTRDLHPWYLDGYKVRAMYLQDFEVVGTVVQSRVKYGGAVSHWVELDEPMHIPYSDEPYRTHASITEHYNSEMNELLEILDSKNSLSAAEQYLTDRSYSPLANRAT